MKSKAYFLLYLFLLSLKHLSAQVPVVEWYRIYGGIKGEYAYSIAPTKDGGYIVSGFTEGNDNADIMGYHGNALLQDYWVTKLNNEGEMEWQKCLGGMSMETGAFIKETADGGFIAAGSSASVDCMVTGNHGGLDFWVVKLTTTGDIVWQKSLGGNKSEYAWSIISTTDGGYIIAGDTESATGDVSGNHGQRDFWVVKIDALGNILWQKCLGGSGDETAYSVTETPDGGCVAAGYTESSDGDVSGNHGKRDFWIVKLSGTGNLQWQKCLGGTESEQAWSVKHTKNGGIIIAGYSASNDGDVSGNHQALGKFSDIWVVKLDINGILEWQKCYGGQYNETGYYIQEAPDGGYIICGDAESANGDLTCNEGITDMWALKISETGILQWQKSFGGSYYDQAFCIEPTTDGGCIVAGNTCSQNLDGYHINPNSIGSCADFFILKLSPPQTTTPAPVVKINPSSASVCPNRNAVFTAITKYAGLRPTYQWKKNGVVDGNNSTIYTAAGLQDNDVVSCTIISSSECGNSGMVATDNIVIKVNTSPPVQFVQIGASQTVLCNCSTIIFTANVCNAGASPLYKWKVNGVAAGRNANIFQSSTLKSGDVITCEYADNLTCVANGFIVSNAVTISSGTIAPSVTVTAAKSIICSGEEVQFTATPVNAGINPSYQWKVNSVNTGSNQPVFKTNTLNNNDTVSCIITGDPSFTCSSVINATSNKVVIAVTQKTSPVITVNSSATSICNGTTVTFTAKATNAGNNPTWQWKVNGINAGNNDSVFISNTLNNGDKVTCEVTIDASYTCSNSNSSTSNIIEMEVTAGTAATISIATLNNPVCEGKPVSFQAIVTNAGINPFYSWKVNNISAGNNSDLFSSASLKNGDQVSCTLTPGSGGCSSTPVLSNNIIMNIYTLPVISITPFDTLVAYNSQVHFQTVVSEPPINFNWFPPQFLENSSILSPLTIPLTDNRSFTLQVVNSNGCEAEKKVNVFIYQPLRMPNAFTPNADGLNDVFAIPANVNLHLIEFSVYNRWGQTVFTTNTITKGWDGTFEGKPALPGLYTYFIKGFNEQGVIQYKGTVLLIL